MKLVVATVAVVTTALAASVGTAIGQYARRSTAVRSPDRPVVDKPFVATPEGADSSTAHPSVVSRDRRARHLDPPRSTPSSRRIARIVITKI